MKKNILFFPVLILSIFFLACNTQQNKQAGTSIRNMIDTVGFASKAYQMDSIISRINNTQSVYLENIIKSTGVDNTKQWKVCISPHDDYSYVGYLYPAVLNNVKATTLIIFGVAHKASKLGLENKIIFDSYTSWHAPYGNVKTSSIRDKIISALPKDVYIVNNQMQSMEHSVPFGLLTAYYLQNQLNEELKGFFIGYATSIDHEHIKVDDINMGITATASDHHWVGYAAVGYY